MGNTLKMEKRQQIQALALLGWSNRAISEHTGIDRDTISKYRYADQNPPKVPTDPQASGEENASGQNPPEVPADAMKQLPGTNSAQLRPFVSIVAQKHLQHLTAQRIYQDLVEKHDYKGSYDSVKRYARKLRKKHRRYYERLPHLPGREAQVDFGKSPCVVKVNGRYRHLWIFKMTLTCSKHAYEELVEHQDLETFLRCHERAFTFFGGVPEIVTLDNLKSGVITACMYEPILNATYLAFATYWGFAANPCMPRTPEHKGVVERDIGYTKHNALDGNKYESVADANVALRYWNKRWARTRIHGTTKCQVWKLFNEIERPVLQPLKDKPFEYFLAGKRKVDVNGLIEVDLRYYGVPPKYVGSYVIVHYNQEWVKVFSNEILIITHRCLMQKGKVSRCDSCQPGWKHPSHESQERYYLQKARHIGPYTHKNVYSLLCDPHPLSIRRVRGILSLESRFGTATLEEAAEMASRTSIIGFRAIRSLCERINAGQTEQSPITQSHELIRPLEEYESIVMERTLS